MSRGHPDFDFGLTAHAESAAGLSRDLVAPWQAGPLESFVEEWAFRSPPGDAEVFAMPRRGRPRYVGPRKTREIWEQAKLAVVDHALRNMNGEDGRAVDGTCLTYPTPVTDDPLSTHVSRWYADRLEALKRRAPPTAPPWPQRNVRGRLTDMRHAEASQHGVPESNLWHPGLPEVPANGSRYLPRWWLWRYRWPGLHWLQRRDPLPVYRDAGRTGQRFIVVHVHEATPEDVLPESLRVFRVAGYAYTPSSTTHGGGLDRWITQMTATITAGPQSPSTKLPPQWRATVDPLVAEGWSRDWRRVP